MKRKPLEIYPSVDCPQFRKGPHQNVTLWEESVLAFPAHSLLLLLLYCFSKKQTSPRLTFVLYQFSYCSFIPSLLLKKRYQFPLVWKVRSILHILAFQVPLKPFLTLCSTSVLQELEHLSKLVFQNLYQFSPTTILPNRHLTSLSSLLCLPSLYVQDLPPHLDYKPSLTTPLQEFQH